MTGPAPSVLEEIAGRVGTPVYVYDGESIDADVARWTAAVPAGRLWYAVKANSNLAVLRRLADRGLGFEAATPGEYARVRAAGVPASRVMFGGVPKGAREVEFALGERADLVVLQSSEEVEAAAAAAVPRGGRPVPVGIRVRPGVRAGAHPSLETATASAKFGLAPEEVPAAWARLSETAGLEPRALAFHLGSGLDSVRPYETALERILGLAGPLAAEGMPVRELDVGGGLGIDYGGGSGGPEPAALVDAVEGRIRDAGMAARYEPGRSLVARSGLLLTRVLYRRERADGPALVCDAAFTDFARHVLYGARHRIEPVGGSAGGEPTVDVLGATCESGDVLGTGRPLHGVRAGALLAVRDVGAYGFVMASNYNARPRPAEVMVEDGEWRVVRRRESLEDLWRGETA